MKLKEFIKKKTFKTCIYVATPKLNPSFLPASLCRSASFVKIYAGLVRFDTPLIIL